jgi:hypothetical protein
VAAGRVRDRALIAVHHITSGLVRRAAALRDSYESTAASLITA